MLREPVDYFKVTEAQKTQCISIKPKAFVHILTAWTMSWRAVLEPDMNRLREHLHTNRDNRHWPWSTLGLLFISSLHGPYSGGLFWSLIWAGLENIFILTETTDIELDQAKGFRSYPHRMDHILEGCPWVWSWESRETLESSVRVVETETLSFIKGGALTNLTHQLSKEKEKKVRQWIT